jgi:retron-type reverse transcriptase
MYNHRLYEIAYDKLRSNPGNMTQGINPTTLDGLSFETIDGIINLIKSDKFQFSPGRRTQIPKANGGTRPLTIAPPLDKLVQEVMRMILEAIFEPTFSSHSHGFRTGKGCHTALREVSEQFGVAT